METITEQQVNEAAGVPAAGEVGGFSVPAELETPLSATLCDRESLTQLTRMGAPGRYCHRDYQTGVEYELCIKPLAPQSQNALRDDFLTGFWGGRTR